MGAADPRPITPFPLQTEVVRVPAPEALPQCVLPMPRYRWRSILQHSARTSEIGIRKPSSVTLYREGISAVSGK